MFNVNQLLVINALLNKNEKNINGQSKSNKFMDYLTSLYINNAYPFISPRKFLNANLQNATTFESKILALAAFYKLLTPEKIKFFASYVLPASMLAEEPINEDLFDNEAEVFFDNYLEDTTAVSFIYDECVAELNELSENYKVIHNSSTVVIEPDLVKFTPVTHAIFEKKTIFSPFSHPFHIVDPSPWPFCTSIALWFMALNTIAMVHSYLEFNLVTCLMGLLYLLFSLAGWWRDVIRESTYEFKHTPYVRRGLLLGMMLFIISEVMFFFGFFWAFFHSSLVPSPAIGGVWPPVTIMVISPWKLPLVNTLLLLLSGVTLTISHRCLVYLPYYNQAEFVIEKIIGLIMLWLRRTIYLGVFFLFCQAFEYYFASFTFQDTVYGGTFYILTGLHGLHVLVGTIFLIVCLWRTSLLHFTVWKQVGFKSAVWYWHFVDVVWIFLYLVIYVWGNAV
jgi:heme/copper-type cytochrome/quinol oxidase subunit 3